MATYVVKVQFDSKSKILSILNPDPIILASGDEVIWQFSSIPSMFAPEVDFQSPDQPYGPFQGVHVTFGPDQSAKLIGEGRAGGGERSYECRPQIGRWMTDTDELVYESVNTVAIQKAEGASEPPKEVLVRVSTQQSQVTVEPELLKIFEGDVVIWYFIFDDPVRARDYRPVVYFRGAVPLDNGLTPTGPFEDLAFAELQEGPFQYRAIGSGNNDVVGNYFYMVGAEPADETNERLYAVVDPVIDNSGPPATVVATEVRTSVAA
ncbi:MAG TPA: hypothetical protein VF789_34610 [Thermoanaerobaculia bacterium]